MQHELTDEQIAALRSVPLGTMRNKVRIAIAMAGVQQTDIVQATSLAPSQVSNAATGRPTIVEVARAIAEFFGCAIEDLWPSPVAGVELASERRSGADRRTA